jgi:diguanylate cyclase (GGDEF)-like protein
MAASSPRFASQVAVLGPLVKLGLVVAVLLGLVADGLDHYRAAETYVGVLVEQRGEHLLIVRTEPDKPAWQAGLRAGDYLLAVGSDEVHSLAEFGKAADRLEPGAVTVFRVRRGEQALEVPVVPGGSYPWAGVVLEMVCVLGYLLLSLLSLRHAGEDLRARLLGLFAAAVAIELSLPDFGEGLGALIGTVLLVALNGAQIGTELHLAAVIPQLQSWIEPRRWVVKGFYAVGLGGAAAVIVAMLLDHSGVAAGISDPILTVWEGPGYMLWAMALLLLLGRQAIRYPEPEGRQQAALVLSGALPWITLTVLGEVSRWLGLILPSWVYPLWPIALLLYPVAVFVAIFRYHLFDLERVVKRSLIYTTLTTSLLALFYVALVVLGWVFSTQLEAPPSNVTVAVAAMLAGLAFAPTRRAIEYFVARRVFPERHATRQRLVTLAGELPALGTLPAMGRRLVQSLVEIFAARAATILIADPKSGILVTLASSLEGLGRDMGQSLLLAPDDPGIAHLRDNPRAVSAEVIGKRSPSLRQRLAQLDAEFVVPLTFNDQLVGLVVVGAKHGGSQFRAEELELLGLLGHHVASVLENARLFESATYESLTGVLRREAVLEILEREAQRATRYGRPLAVAMVDLDHFKAVNDRFGHLGGDGVLQRVAQILRGGLRATDSIGRYGGEEFLLVLPETPLDGAVAVAEKIRETVFRSPIPMPDDDAITVTTSIGLAELAAADPVSARELLRRADEALYQAKHEGRNRVQAWGA